jgi:hypothetical protein
MRGGMTITISLADSDAGTELTAAHDGLLPSGSPVHNETGWRMALDNSRH